MHENETKAENLEIVRKKLLYRATHRGTQEMDLILGLFAKAHLSSMSFDELKQFQHILDHMEDPDLYSWLTGQVDVPEDIKNPVLEKILLSEICK